MKLLSWYIMIFAAGMYVIVVQAEQEPNVNVASSQNGANNHTGVIDVDGTSRAANPYGRKGNGSAQTCYPSQGSSGNFKSLPGACMKCHPGGVSSKAAALKRLQDNEMPPPPFEGDRSQFITFINKQPG